MLLEQNNSFFVIRVDQPDENQHKVRVIKTVSLIIEILMNTSTKNNVIRYKWIGVTLESEIYHGWNVWNFYIETCITW